MECTVNNQGPSFDMLHTIKSGETVVIYNDNYTQELHPLSQHLSHKQMSCSIGTQTETRGFETGVHEIQNSQSTGTETDLCAVSDKKTLESLLKWALSICSTHGDSIFSTRTSESNLCSRCADNTGIPLGNLDCNTLAKAGCRYGHSNTGSPLGNLDCNTLSKSGGRYEHSGHGDKESCTLAESPNLSRRTGVSDNIPVFMNAEEAKEYQYRCLNDAGSSGNGTKERTICNLAEHANNVASRMEGEHSSGGYLIVLGGSGVKQRVTDQWSRTVSSPEAFQATITTTSQEPTWSHPMSTICASEQIKEPVLQDQNRAETEPSSIVILNPRSVQGTTSGGNDVQSRELAVLPDEEALRDVRAESHSSARKTKLSYTRKGIQRARPSYFPLPTTLKNIAVPPDGRTEAHSSASAREAGLAAPMDRVRSTLKGIPHAQPPLHPPHRKNTAELIHTNGRSHRKRPHTVTEEAIFASPLNTPASSNEAVVHIPGLAPPVQNTAEPISTDRSSHMQEEPLMEPAATNSPGNILKCPYCTRGPTNLLALQRHIERHTQERSYECNVCSKRFKKMDTLNSHYRKHTGEKPYKCSECDKAFISRASKYQHIRTAHAIP